MRINESSAAVKALAHPIRREIISCIARGITSPGDISEHLGEGGPSLGTVSYHVRMLREYGLIEVERVEPRRGALQHFYRFTSGAVAEFMDVRELASGAIRSARRGARKAVAA